MSGKLHQQGEFLVDGTVVILRSEGLFQIIDYLSIRDKANSGRDIWFFRGLFDRQDSLVWIYFRLCGVVQDRL